MGFLGKALKGAGKAVVGGVGGAAKGLLTGGPAGALSGAASGALGSLLGGGGAKGALRGALLGGAGGAVGQQAGLSPAAIAALSGLGNALISEQGKQRQASEKAFDARQALLGRNLGLAEGVFADKGGLRDIGQGALRGFFGSGGGKGIFRTPAASKPGDISIPQPQSQRDQALGASSFGPEAAAGIGRLLKQGRK